MIDVALSPTDRARLEYSFDSRGFVVWPRLLVSDKLEEARRCLESRGLAAEQWHDGQRRASGLHHVPGFLRSLGEALYGHPVTDFLISYPHRMLESYAIERTWGSLDLHGGNAEFLDGRDVRDISARSWVEGGRIYSLRVKVLIYLDDVTEVEDGRFGYIEGSHKSAFAFHRAFPEGRGCATGLWRAVEMRAGDIVWLNEALLHGAEEKTSPKRRRLLAFTYGPAFMANWKELHGPSQSASGYLPTETEGKYPDGRLDE